MSPSHLTRPPLLLHTIAGRQRAERRDREDRFRHARRHHDARRAARPRGRDDDHAHLARTDTPWHRLDVRHWDALATPASASSASSTRRPSQRSTARSGPPMPGDTPLSLELQQISSVTPEALDALLAPHSAAPPARRRGPLCRHAGAARVRRSDPSRARRGPLRPVLAADHRARDRHRDPLRGSAADDRDRRRGDRARGVHRDRRAVRADRRSIAGSCAPRSSSWPRTRTAATGWRSTCPAARSATRSSPS